MSQLSLVTPPPSPPAILLPLHVRVRALLRPTCNEGPQLAGREQERSRIEGFLRTFMVSVGSESNHSALYISGSPGTGKTALVNATLHALADELSAQDIQLLVVNCMALEGIDAVWQQLSDMLVSGSSPKGRGRKVKGKPQQVVEKAFASRNHKWCVSNQRLPRCMYSWTITVLSCLTNSTTLLPIYRCFLPYLRSRRHAPPI